MRRPRDRHRLRRRDPGVQPGGGRRAVRHARARAGAGDRGVRRTTCRLGTYTRIVDLINGDGVEVVAGNCVGGSSVIYFAASLRAPSFVFDRRGSHRRGRLWPRPITAPALDPWYDRVEETLPVAAAGLERRPVRGRRVGRRLPPRRPHLQPGAAGGRPAAVHQLQLDAEGLPLRRQAVDAAQLPAGGPRARRAGPAAPRGAVDRPGVTAGYRYRVEYTCVDPDDYRLPQGGGTIEAKVVVLAAGAMGTPVILQRSAAGLGGVPSAVGRYFSPNGDRVSMALLDEEQARLGARPASAARGRLRGLPHRQADRVDELRLPRRRAAGVRPVLAAADLLPVDHQHPARGRHRRASRSGSASTRRPQRPVAVLAHAARADRGRQRGRLRAAARRPATSSGPHPPRRSATLQLPGERRTPAAAGTPPTRRSGRSSRRTASAGTSPGSAASPRCRRTRSASCRIGDDPATSALTTEHELRGSPGLFVTDGSAVPTSLTVNPSLTIAALAERASVAIARSATDAGIALTAGVPAPGNA